MDYDEKPEPPNPQRDAWIERSERLERERDGLATAARDALAAYDECLRGRPPERVTVAFEALRAQVAAPGAAPLAPKVVDWCRMTTEEQYAALKAAPKVAGPWVDVGRRTGPSPSTSAYVAWRREDARGNELALIARLAEDPAAVRVWWRACGDGEYVGSLEIAARDADAALVAAGWLVAKPLDTPADFSMFAIAPPPPPEAPMPKTKTTPACMTDPVDDLANALCAQRRDPAEIKSLLRASMAWTLGACMAERSTADPIAPPDPARAYTRGGTERLLEMLRAFEGHRANIGYTCPICTPNHNGHAATCDLAAALR